jgi:uncharacterized protein YfiM (DUF2279 family)
MEQKSSMSNCESTCLLKNQSLSLIFKNDFQPPAQNLTLNVVRDEIEREGTIQLKASDLTESMGSLIVPKDTLIFNKVDPNELSCGDIVLFFNGDELVAHRVICLFEDFLITKGDAVDYHDMPIKKEDCIGKLVKVKRGVKEIGCFLNKGVEPNLDFLFLNATLPEKFRREDYLILLINKLCSHQRLLQLLYAEGLAQLFFFYNENLLQKYGLPEEALRCLAHYYYDTLARNIVVLKKIKSILSELYPAKCILLKGTLLADCLYDTPALRSFSDIDVLVKLDDFDAVSSRLKKMDFVCDNENMPAASVPSKGNWLNSVCFCKKDELPMKLHIHWHWCNSSRPIYLPISEKMESVWLNAVSHDDAAHLLYLTDEHLLINLCEHAIKHSFDRLILLRDIVEVLIKRQHQINWDFLIKEAFSSGMARQVYYSLLYVSRISPLLVPAFVLATLKPDRNSVLSKAFFRLAEKGVRDPELMNLIYFEMMPDLKAKLSFIKRTIVPVGGVEKKVMSRKEKKNSMPDIMRHFRKIGMRLFLIIRGLCSRTLFLFLPLFLILMQSINASAEEDRWLEEDKALHFTACFAIDSGGYWASREGLGLSKKKSLILAAFGTAGVGVLKELTDEEFSGKDLTWDFFGIALSSILWWSLDWRDDAESSIKVGTILSPNFGFMAISADF